MVLVGKASEGDGNDWPLHNAHQHKFGHLVPYLELSDHACFPRPLPASTTPVSRMSQKDVDEF